MSQVSHKQEYNSLQHLPASVLSILQNPFHSEALVLFNTWIRLQLPHLKLSRGFPVIHLAIPQGCQAYPDFYMYVLYLLLPVASLHA